MNQQTIRTMSHLDLREETLEGRRHLVAPVVALVEGVHNGLFYSAKELAKFVECWNGIPVPVFHPEIGGNNVSANTPEMIERQTVGRFFHAHFDPAGAKLKGEVWIDILKAQSISPRILTDLRSGVKMEVSTALWCDGDDVPGNWRGEPFETTVCNFRPDHLALLPGGIGACSWGDGCGIRANEMVCMGGGKCMEENVRNTARRPTFLDKETIPWANVDKTFGAYRDAWIRATGSEIDPPTRVQDAPVAMKRWIAARTLLGEGNADNERDLIFFPVVNARTGQLNEGALRAVLGGRAAQADIPEAAKESAQRMARSLLDSEFNAELSTENEEQEGRIKGLFKSLMEAVGFKVENEHLSHENIRDRLQMAVDALDNQGFIHFVKEVFDDFFIFEARGGDPALFGADGTVKLWRQGFSVDEEEGKVILADDAVEVREERQFIPIESTTENEQEEEQVGNEEKKALVDGLIGLTDGFIETDRHWLNTLDEEQLKKMAAKPEQQTANCLKINECTHKDCDCNAAQNDQTTNEDEKEEDNKPVTLESYIANAPGEIGSFLARAVKREEEIKNSMIEELMANKRNRFTEDQLKQKDLSELETLALLADVPVANYTGQGGAGKTVVNEDEEDGVPEMIPVFDLSGNGK